MNCPQCEAANPDDARFCANCGASLSMNCTNCGTSLQPGAKFCHNCGQPVVPVGVRSNVELASPAAISAQPADIQRYIPQDLLVRLESARRSRMMEGERRIVTILFCDVKGSTLTASQLDPEEWAEIINGAFEHMIQAVYRYEGTVVRLLGDGLLAFFGAPIAHEDDPQRAVLAGLDIIQGIQDYQQVVKEQWGIDFEVRVGINTGLVVVGAIGSDLRMEYSGVGDAVNMAARMEQNAQPGSVFISEATHKLIAPLFNFERVEGLEVKGRLAPVTAYRVLGTRQQPGSLRGVTGLQAPLIGRVTQLETLLTALDELKNGQGQIVSVTGEAGLGKSRLVAEFHQAVVVDPDLDPLWMEGRALSYDKTIPFAPFINLFRDFFELDSGDSDAVQVEELTARIESLLPGQGDSLAPFFGLLLGLTLEPEAEERVKYLEPPQLKGMLFAHVFAFLEALLSQRRLILYLDDLHWADPTSLELYQSLLPLTDRSPLMLVTSFRADHEAPSWGYHEQAERDYSRHYTVIPLLPLDEDHSRQLVESLLEVEDLPEYARKLILEKSEGNPFFVEEIIRSLVDEGVISNSDGRWQVVEEMSEIEVPDTLVGVITARLDRLDESTRHVIQTAAVIGRLFTAQILEEVVDTPEQLEPALTDLQRRELVREKSLLPQRTYSFKHVLTQDAAYNSILLSNRRELHHRVAVALIEQRPEAVADIARHLLEARQVARAVPYLVQAGEKAARAYATEEAIGYFRQALEFLSMVEEDGLARRTYEGLGSALRFANRIPEAKDIYQEMLALAESTGDVPMQISALNKLAGLYALLMGQFQEAEGLLARAEALSRQNEEKSSLPETSLIRCQMCTAQADFKSVVEYMDEVIGIGEDLGSPEYVVMGLEHVSTSLVYMTEFDKALPKGKRGLEIARQINDREHEASFLSVTLPMIYIRRGEFEKARTALQEGLEIATKIGSLPYQTLSAYILAEIARWQGEYENALKYGQQSLGAALPLEPYAPFLVVPTLGSLGSTYQEISDQFIDKISEFHLHALRLLESPAAALTGGVAWADLGYCAIALGDLKVAEEATQKGLNYPNMFMHLERPRHLADAALLESMRGEHEEAVKLAQQASEFARERGMRHLYPFTDLIKGRVLVAKGELESGLKSLAQAESQALSLEMRPIVWQAHAAAAHALDEAGRSEQAALKRAAAQAMIKEIANMFEDKELGEAFLNSSLARVR